MYSTLLIFHVLAATVWTGGHIVLSLCLLPHALKQKDIHHLKFFESVYERVGMPALVIQIITGAALLHMYWPKNLAVFALESPIQVLLWSKLMLLFLTIAFAIDARLRVIPNLDSDKLIDLAFHIIPVTLFSIAFAILGVGFRLGWLN